MIYKHFNRRLGIYLFVLIASAFTLGISFYYHLGIGYQMIISTFLAYSLIKTILFLNKTNKQISYFIHAIKNDDTTLRFPKNNGNKTIDELHASLNELNAILQQTKLKSQINERYFAEILQNIGTGVIVFNNKGFITEVNPAALELFGLQTLTHLAQFDKVDPNFRIQLEQLSGGQKHLLFLNKRHEKIQLVTRCTTIKLKDETVKLLSLQDIHGELERKELDSWVKLIRVLNHEIMNSLTPVTSITQALKEMWSDQAKEHQALSPLLIKNTLKGLDVIGERSEALIRFVQSYRLLTHVPHPQIQKVTIHELFDSLSILTSPFTENENLKIIFHYPTTNFELSIDQQMMTQVMINLVKNAVEATTNKPDGRIEISASQNELTHLTVMNNGPKIEMQILDEIFIPFFTTKKDGTGIGLSYSQLVVKAQGGTINCTSTDKQTIFDIALQSINPS
jgi:two-component system, NtrC family, nitrogen regulation sensor histidine kinase NtrY